MKEVVVVIGAGGIGQNIVSQQISGKAAEAFCEERISTRQQ